MIVFLMALQIIDLSIGNSRILYDPSTTTSMTTTATATTSTGQNVLVPVVIATVKNTPTPSPTPTALNAKTLGCKGDGITNDQVAIEAAIAKAKSEAKPLFFPSGKYIHNKPITLSGVTVYGEGQASELYGSDPMNHCVWIKGTATTLRNIRINSNVGTLGRVARYEATAVMGIDPVNAIIDGVIIESALCSGIWFENGNGCTVQKCRVLNTKSDGIHFSKGCRNCLIEANYVDNTGDDNIASMSYVWQPVQNKNIVIRGNTCKNSWRARGITTQGLDGGLVENNYVFKSAGAGVYCCSESNEWNSYPTRKVTIRGNTIEACGFGIDHPSIMVWSQGPLSTHGVFDTLIEANSIVNPVRDGIKIMANTDRTTVRMNACTGLKTGKVCVRLDSGALNVIIQ